MEHQVESGTKIQSAATMPSAISWAKNGPVRIRFCGHDFIAAPEMAGLFLRRAQKLIDDGDAQLVPLLHHGGVELLYVTADTPFSVHEATDAVAGADRIAR